VSRVLVMSGSSRTGSFNRKLAAVAAQAARGQGAEVTEVDLRALALPVYDADVEAQGLPPGALELRRLFNANEAVLISAPEYNAFVTPLLVNTLDWVSRVPAEGDAPAGLAAMNGTVAGLLSASPGALAGLRGLIFLRAFLSASLGMLVVPETQSVGQAHQAFDEAGALRDAKQQAGVERVVAAVLRAARA
jgi:NAD(P)H-dependent FMN reductase